MTTIECNRYITEMLTNFSVKFLNSGITDQGFGTLKNSTEFIIILAICKKNKANRVNKISITQMILDSRDFIFEDSF